MTTQRRGRPRKFASGPLHDRYRELESLGWSAVNISRKLDDEFPGIAPDLRNVQRWVRADRSLDTSGPWRLWMSDPEDVPAIFRTLGVVIEVSDGQTRWLSAPEAEWIARIHRMGVRLADIVAYHMARMLARAQARDDGDRTAELIFAEIAGLLNISGVVGADQSLTDWLERGPAGVRRVSKLTGEELAAFDAD